MRQGDDGWWRVASALTSKTSEASKDYVYDYWGTAWATIGLADWLPARAEPSLMAQSALAGEPARVGVAGRAALGPARAPR